MKIGFIGAGKMAQAIISGLNEAQRAEIAITSHDFALTKATAEKLGVQALASNQTLVDSSELIVLAVKPQVLPRVLEELDLTTDKTLLSIAAGIDLAALSGYTSETQPLIRVMPNINATIQKATSAIVRNGLVTDEVFAVAKLIFEQLGSLHEIPEKDFSTFTALAGSSPAFIYEFIDDMAVAGVRHGLPKAEALQIVAETVAASAEMILRSDKHPQQLVDEVSSPAGTTVEGMVALHERGFKAMIIAAITATIDKEKSLKEKL